MRRRRVEALIVFLPSPCRGYSWASFHPGRTPRQDLTGHPWQAARLRAEAAAGASPCGPNIDEAVERRSNQKGAPSETARTVSNRPNIFWTRPLPLPPTFFHAVSPKLKEGSANVLFHPSRFNAARSLESSRTAGSRLRGFAACVIPHRSGSGGSSPLSLAFFPDSRGLFCSFSIDCCTMADRSVGSFESFPTIIIVSALVITTTHAAAISTIFTMTGCFMPNRKGGSSHRRTTLRWLYACFLQVAVAVFHDREERACHRPPAY